MVRAQTKFLTTNALNWSEASVAYCQGRRHGSNLFVGEPLPLRDSSERRPLPNIKQAFDYCAHHPAAVNKDRASLDRQGREGFCEERTFEQRPDSRESMSWLGGLWPGRENSNMKTPNMGTSWAGAELKQESWCGQTCGVGSVVREIASDQVIGEKSGFYSS